MGVLVERGADAQYIGLSRNDVLFASQRYMEGRREIHKNDPAQQTKTSGRSDPQTEAAGTSSTEDLQTTGPGTGGCEESIQLMVELTNQHREVDALCAIVSRSLSIIRVGLPEMCNYVLQKRPCADSATLQAVPDTRSRIPHGMYTDAMGFRHRKYGQNNIKGIVGVAVAEGPAGKTSRKAPTTYVKIKWAGIAHADAVLCPNGYSWITRSDFIRMVGQIVADAKIREAWKNQQERYTRWIECSS